MHNFHALLILGHSDQFDKQFLNNIKFSTEKEKLKEQWSCSADCRMMTRYVEP